MRAREKVVLFTRPCSLKNFYNLLFPFSYRGKSTDTLSSLRYATFMESVATSMHLKPENLPPTAHAPMFHAYRVHVQVAQWKALSLDCLNPLEYGWTQKDGIMTPAMTDQEAAP